MSSSAATSMDISETFRPEDLSKTDFFDFVTAPDMGINVVDIDRPPSRDALKVTNGNNDHQPLQGFDQFWGADKESNRIDTAMFDDLNRYCWNQPGGNQLSGNTATSSISDPQMLNADGQIYTITVLNSSSTDQWLRKDLTNSIDQSTGIDLDTILSNYPYVKTECFSYDDSGFGTDHTKDDIVAYPPLPIPPRPGHQSSGVTTTTNIILERNLSIPSFDQNGNNNNEWHLIDEQNSPESLLRSALQGKGYVKTLQTQNGITVIPVQNPAKDDELRRVLFPNDQDTISFADSTLTNPIFEDDSNHQSAGVVVDDMFLTLDSAFTDDFEKIKRIASEVQQFCSASSAEGNHTYPDILIETAINQNSSILTTNDITNNNSITINNNSSNIKINKTKINAIKTTKKYKKSHNNNTSNSLNNNNTSTINNNLSNSTSKSLINMNISSPVSSNAPNGSPTHSNGQRKERSLHYCTICGKGFKDKYSVNVHIRTHTGEKPFACGICGKSFRQKAHLAKHYQTHLAQKNASGSTSKSSKQPQQQQLTTGTPPQIVIQSSNSAPSVNTVVGR